MKKLILALALSVGSFFGPANIPAIAQSSEAGWQFTTWGMSVDELKAASPVPISNSPDNCSGHTPYSSPYSTGSFDFVACYHFNANGLYHVRLQLLDLKQGAKLREALEDLYGVGRRENPLGTLNITWRSENFRVSFNDSQQAFGSIAPRRINVNYYSYQDSTGL